MSSAKYSPLFSFSFHNCPMFTFFVITVITFCLLVSNCSSLPVPVHLPFRDSTLQLSNGTITDAAQNNHSGKLLHQETKEIHEISSNGWVSTNDSSPQHETTKRYVISPSPITLVTTKDISRSRCHPPQYKIDELESIISGEDVHFANIINMNELIENRPSSSGNLSEAGNTYSRSYYQSLGERNCDEVKKMLATLAPKKEDVLCPWDYLCSYDEERYPKYIITAICSTTRCKRGCSTSGYSLCRPIIYPMQILKVQESGACHNGTDQVAWTAETHNIILGCECPSDQ